MNTKQLNYIREKQQENIFVIPTVSMREDIDSFIIEELETVYNPDIGGLETEYKASLNDISMPHDFLEDTKMISCTRKYGGIAVLIYMYLHSKMCKEGYKIIWNEMQKDVIKATLFGVYKVDIKMIDMVIASFIEEKLLHVVDDGKEQYLTSVYQVFIFERVASKRLRDRIYKRNTKISKSADKLKVETKLPVFKDEISVEPSQMDAGANVVNTVDVEESAPDGFMDLDGIELPFT